MTDSLSRTIRLPWRRMLLACLASALLVGCGETISTGTVRGKVTLDEAPYGDAAVVFMSRETGQAGSANIQADGTFQIETPLPVGSYVVFLAPKSAASEEESDQPVEEAIDKSVPEKYWNEATSDISLDVVEGQNDFTVPLSK